MGAERMLIVGEKALIHYYFFIKVLVFTIKNKVLTDISKLFLL
jgi:hypothetical protein